DDIGRRRTFNTAIAAVMELLNAIGRVEADSPLGWAVRHEAFESAVISLSPLIPHVTHVLRKALGHDEAVVAEPWPNPDPQALVQDTVEIVVQVNGKLRGRVSLAVDADETAAREAALSDENVRRFVGEKPVRKVIFVRGKLVNLVV